MKKSAWIWGLLLLSACSNPGQDDPFAILSGHWIKRGNTAVIAEHWEQASDRAWIGAVYRIEEGDSLLVESLEIRAAGDSGFVYWAAVEGQNEGKSVPFDLKTYLPDSLFVFENANHDFPQKISYRLLTPDSLEIVLGLLADESKDRQFYFGRVKNPNN